jgi:hypothetical protein
MPYPQLALVCMKHHATCSDKLQNGGGRKTEVQRKQQQHKGLIPHGRVREQETERQETQQRANTAVSRVGVGQGLGESPLTGNDDWGESGWGGVGQCKARWPLPNPLQQRCMVRALYAACPSSSLGQAHRHTLSHPGGQ